MIHRLLFIAADTILVVCLLIISFYIIRDTAMSGGLPLWFDWSEEPDLRHAAIGMAVLVGGFWALRVSGQHQVAFWMVALAGLVVQMPSILSHSVLDWTYLLAKETWFATSASSFRGALLLLLSLMILVLLFRSIQLQELHQTLVDRGADSPDRNRLIVAKALTTGTLVALGLVLTLMTVYAGAAIGGNEQLLGSSPWAVVMIGGGAIFLMALLPLLWLQDHVEG